MRSQPARLYRDSGSLDVNINSAEAEEELQGTASRLFAPFTRTTDAGVLTLRRLDEPTGDETSEATKAFLALAAFLRTQLGPVVDLASILDEHDKQDEKADLSLVVGALLQEQWPLADIDECFETYGILALLRQLLSSDAPVQSPFVTGDDGTVSVKLETLAAVCCCFAHQSVDERAIHNDEPEQEGPGDIHHEQAQAAEVVTEARERRGGFHVREHARG